jgi:hypothetical protein
VEGVPRLNKRVLTVVDLEEGESRDRAYWHSRSPFERIEAVEIQRRMVYGEDRVTSRLQRFLEVAELA